MIAYVADVQGGLLSVNIDDPTSPYEMNRCATSYNVLNVSAFGSYTCVSGGEYAGLRVVDPSDCDEEGYYNTPGQTEGSFVSETLIYVADYEGGVAILDYYGSSSIGGQDTKEKSLPRAFCLSQNYPNPFNPTTTISFKIQGKAGKKQHTTLTVYDLRGRLVKTLVDEKYGPGSHQVVWDGKNIQGQQVSSGIYLYTLKSGDKRYTKKMVVVK